MANKKKICFVLPNHSSLTVAGAEYQADCLMNRILELDKYSVYYITNGSDPNFTSEKYCLIKLDLKHKNIFSLMKASKELLNTLKEIKPDIIYQRVGCYQTAVCAYYSRNYNCVSVCHIASDLDVDRYRFHWDRSFLYKFFEKKMQEYGLKRATKVIAQTNSQGETLKKNFERHTDAVVYNFHPIPQNHSKKEDIKQIVWIANIRKLKKPEMFLKLANDLYPTTRAKFIMIGNIQGPRRWNQKILKQIQMNDGIEYLGPVTQDEVNHILDRSHVLVNTSTVEGFSNTFIQAWMRKVPVVSLHVDPDNLLEKKQIGRFSGTYERLKQDVKELIEDDPLREIVAKRAYNYSTKYHSFENINKIISLIEK